MNFLSSLALVMTIISGGISCWMFIESRSGSNPPYRQTAKAFGILSVVLLVISLFISFIPAVPASTQNESKNSPQSNVTSTLEITATIGNTPTKVMPSPTNTPRLTPTPTPTPLPYTVSKTGDVCQPPFSTFQASGWAAEGNSFVFSGNGTDAVISPCNITTQNYSVTATIELLQARSSTPEVGVIAHADSGGQTGYASGSGCKQISFGACGYFISDSFSSITNIDQIANLTGQTHTYKLVVYNGVKLQLFYDNSINPVFTKSLASYLQAGYAGFECFDQCQVTGFKVTVP